MIIQESFSARYADLDGFYMIYLFFSQNECKIAFFQCVTVFFRHKSIPDLSNIETQVGPRPH